MKRCSACGVMKPASEFYGDKRRLDGLRARCKGCTLESDKQYRDNNKEKIRSSHARYYAEHKETIKKYVGNSYLRNRARLLAKSKQHYAENIEYYRARRLACKEIERERTKRRAESGEYKVYYRLNKGLIKERKRRWELSHPDYYSTYRLLHKDETRRRSRRWCVDNPSKKKAKEHRRRTKLAGMAGSFTGEEWENLKAFYNHRCLACGLREPEIALTVDHVVAVTKCGSNFIANIQPLCAKCNKSKGTKMIDYRIEYAQQI
jgi:5-methylcytosine-specific restriction endonuclease McrA